MVRVPATVQAVLADRIDRLSAEGKSLLQIASVIGKNVPFALLLSIADIPDELLRERLGHLQTAEFLYEARLSSEIGYTFKHALTHEVAYGSLLKSTRQHYHRRIAAMLVEHFPDTVMARPELVAHHYTEATLGEQAITYWQNAGQHARERSANIEALAHFSKGLRLLETLPESRERARIEADVQIALAQTLHAMKGQSAPEVVRAYERARDLCERIDDAPQLFRVLLGLFRISGQGRRGQHFVEQLYVLAQRIQDPELLLQAHMARGTRLCFVGRPIEALPHLEEAIARYAPQLHHSHALRFGLDPGVITLSRLSWNLWFLGYPEQALARSEAALDLARARAHPHSLAVALHFAATFHQFRRETAAVQQLAEDTLALASTYGLTQWHAAGTFMQGWALTMQGRPDDGLAQMRQGLTSYRATGTTLDMPWYLGLLAAACGNAGRVDEGIALVGEALAAVEDTHFYEADLHRLHGELLLQQDRPDAVRAKVCFQQALELARLREAKSWELRAAISLTRLLKREGGSGEEQQLLRKVYDWFTEGFSTADLNEARALLDRVQ